MRRSKASAPPIDRPRQYSGIDPSSNPPHQDSNSSPSNRGNSYLTETPLQPTSVPPPRLRSASSTPSLTLPPPAPTPRINTLHNYFSSRHSTEPRPTTTPAPFIGHPPSLPRAQPQPALSLPENSRPRSKPNSKPTIELSYDLHDTQTINSVLPPALPHLWNRPPFAFAPASTQRENVPDVWGHAMETIDPHSTFRVLLQNPNGIRPDRNNMEFLLSLQETHDKGIALAGLPETNFNWNDYRNRQHFQDSLRRLWEHSTFATSASSEPFASNYQPGGTCTMVLGSWTNRMIDRGSDPSGLGRWSWVTLRGKSSIKITFITCYRVCDQRSYAGERTAYSQQHRLLQLSGQFSSASAINPRRQTILDLQHFILSLKATGHDVVLLIDSNEPISRAPPLLEDTPVTQPASTFPPPTMHYQHTINLHHDGKLDTLIQACGLTDALRYHHPQGSPPGTYNRGTQRIDFIFITSRLQSCSVRAGLLPFNTFFFGDHRAAFLDFDAAALFHDSTNPLASPKSRLLRLKDPRDVSRYQDTLVTFLDQHRIPQRANSLLQNLTIHGWHPKMAQQYETLDAEITEGMLHAEKACSRRQTGTYLWSLTLARAGEAIRYWKLRRKAFLHLPHSAQQLDQRRRDANISIDEAATTTTLEGITTKLRDAWTNLRQSQAQHQQLRQDYLTDLATAITRKKAPWIDEHHLTSAQADRIATALRNLQEGERRRQTYSRLRSAFAPTLKKGPRSAGLYSLDVPDTERDCLDLRDLGNPEDPASWRGPWRSVSDPAEISAYIAKQNIIQFHQAASTPLGSGRLATALGVAATTPTADAILAGDDLSHLISHLPTEVAHILSTMKAPENIPPINVLISSEKFQEAYKRVPEKTSSSPSGRHVGHYKAALDCPVLCDLHATMMSFPFLSGHSPTRWQTVVDVMLEKDPGSPKIHRLRIIQLLESDKNQALRILYALPLLYFAEDTDQLHDIQYGSRPGRMCISPVLNKTLSYDLMRQTKRTGATLDIDALGCFDRIIQSLVLLLARRLGMPPTATLMLGRTWNSLVHHVRTGYGLSTNSYTSTPSKPLFGAGQGSCAACLFWLLTSTAIYTAMDNIPFGLTFQSVCSSTNHHRKGDSFVDDAAFGMVVTREPNSLLNQATNQDIDLLEARVGIQTIGQLYERYLWVTGGALNLNKCLWYLIAWHWSHGKARLKTISDAPATIELTSGLASSATTIKRLDPTNSHRTLGVFISPSGAMSTSLTILRSAAARFAQCLQDSPLLTASDAYLAFTVFHQPKVSYPLPVLTLSRSQCIHAQAPALLALLPRMHLNRTTARSIVHGTTTYGGLGLQHLYLEQGLGQLKLFLGHLRARDKTSELLRISLGYLQQEIGLPTLAFNLRYPNFKGWIEPTWLTSLWEFLNFVGLTVSVADIWLPTRARENDVFLSEHFLSLRFTKAEMGRLNRCRLFYQAITLSDLTSGDGTLIDERAKKGILLPDRLSDLNWPIQQRPPARDWKLWAKALSFLETNGTLTRPLGRWVSATYHQPSHWAVHPQTHTAYSCHDGQWLAFHPTQQGSRTRAQTRLLYVMPGDPCDPPHNLALHRADLLYDITLPDTIFRLSYAETQIPIDPPVPTVISGTSELHLALRHEPLMLQRLVGPLACTNSNIDSLATVARLHKLHGCSDGSVHQGIGSHAWLFSDAAGAILLRGAGPDDAGSLFMTSYRSELGGLTALLCLLKHILQLRNVLTGQCTIYCDNSAALNNVFKPSLDAGIYPLLESDYDLLGVARLLLSELPITIKHEWVKGHYNGPERQLKHDLNDEADELATEYRQRPDARFRPTAFPTAHPVLAAAVYSNGTMITSRLRNTIYANAYDPLLRNTISKTTGLTEHQMNRIDWTTHGAAFRALSRPQRLAVSKLVHNLWHTNSKAHQHSPTESPNCPLCTQALETSAHVLTCPSQQTSVFRTERYAEFLSTIEHLETPAPILLAWQSGLDYFTQSTQTGVASRPRPPTVGSVRPLDCLVTQAYLDQTSLGWHNFLRGRLSSLWLKAYTYAYTSSPGSACPASWSKTIIHQLWDYSLDLWRFRNGSIYGHNVAEQRLLALQSMREQVARHFDSYQQDPHYVLSRDRSLFTRLPLIRRQAKDFDSLRCWLDSVTLATQASASFYQQQARTAQRFFAAFPSRPAPAPSSALPTMNS